EAGEHLVFFTGHDAVADGVLGELVDRDDRERDERGADPRGECAAAGQPWMMPSTTTRLTIPSTMIATIGLRSIAPKLGIRRRKSRRNGSQMSRRKPSTALLAREYGTRTPKARSHCTTMCSRI